VKEERPHQRVRARGEARDGERRHRTRGLPEVDQRAEKAEAIKGAEEGIRTHSVIDDIHALATGELGDARHEVLLAIEDHLVRAALAGHPGFLRRADRRDDSRAQVLRPAHQQLPHGAPGGVHQQLLAGMHRVHAAQQHAGRQPLDGEGRGRLVAQPVGNPQREARGQEARLGVAAVLLIDVADAIPRREARHSGPHALDDAGRLDTGNPRQGQRAV